MYMIMDRIGLRNLYSVVMINSSQVPSPLVSICHSPEMRLLKAGGGITAASVHVATAGLVHTAQGVRVAQRARKSKRQGQQARTHKP